MNINGKNVKDVWKTFSRETRAAVYNVVGKTYLKGNREFLNKDIYDKLDVDQKKYVNLMCNRAYKAANSPWNVISETGDPRIEGQYWCIIIYRVPSDGFIPHATIDTRFYGDLDETGENIWNTQVGGYVGEEVYAWLDTPIHKAKLPELPYGIRGIE